jgi:hypothetical protein
MTRQTVVSFLLFIFLAAVPATLAAQKPHDRAFWRHIIESHYALPEGASAFSLAQELSALLASPDPELRDDLAYSILYTWIHDPKVLTTSDLVVFLKEWQANLRYGLGETGTNTVLQRSFSALCLASLVERDQKTPFLADAPFRSLLRSATGYLTAERDLRGFDEHLGWIHATAHTADLLAALAADQRLTREEQSSVLAAIAQRLQTAPAVYTEGEQSRLAVAVLAVMHRPDFDVSSFDTWLDQWQDADRKVWKVKPLASEPLAHYQNRTYMLEALVARMSLEKASDALTAPRAHLLKMLGQR